VAELIYTVTLDGLRVGLVVVVVVVVVTLVLNAGPKDLVVQLTIHPIVLKTIFNLK